MQEETEKHDQLNKFKNVLSVISVYYKIRNVTSMALVQVLNQVKTSKEF